MRFISKKGVQRQIPNETVIVFYNVNFKINAFTRHKSTQDLNYSQLETHLRDGYTFKKYILAAITHSFAQQASKSC